MRRQTYPPDVLSTQLGQRSFDLNFMCKSAAKQ
jgi:hypothetical protein